MPATNLRELLGVNASYATFNREERNYAALLYHLLMSSDAALRRFLSMFGVDTPVDPEQVQIYFEYAHLRDLWKRAAEIENSTPLNERRRNVIIHMLDPLGTLGARSIIENELSKRKEASEVERFNALFDPQPKASSKAIQMPGRWGKALLHSMDSFNEELWQRACLLRWAFNAKADLVIHMGNNTALCVEIKYESKEGVYKLHRPVRSEINDKKNPCKATQLQVQQFILGELLGMETRFALISKDDVVPRSIQNDDIAVTRKSWGQVLETLRSAVASDTDLMRSSRSRFISTMIETLTR